MGKIEIAAVVGGQYGSEAKGNVVGNIARQYQVHVRVGAANAGHTYYSDLLQKDEKHVLQQLPVAAYANPTARLVLGAGAMISPEILAAEVERNNEWRRKHGFRLLHEVLHIDPRAHVVLPGHIEQESKTDLVARIGSTSTQAREGIGAAQAARVMRTGYMTWQQFVDSHDVPYLTSWISLARHRVLASYDTVKGLVAGELGESVLLEGTQGAGLNVVTGQYPYVTSRCTTSAGLLADTGLPPTSLSRVIMVLRTYPIRVAGNSGPFYPDSDVISWSSIGVDENQERTTVTKKVRRVATFSLAQARDAAAMNGATEVALMFADYMGYKPKGGNFAMKQLPSELRTLVEKLDCFVAPVTMLGVGPRTILRRMEHAARNAE